MKKFRIMIAVRLFYSEADGKRSAEISEELKLLDSTARKLSELEMDHSKAEEFEKFSKELEARYPFNWDALDDFQKSTMRANGQTPGAKDCIRQRSTMLIGGLEVLTQPVKDEIVRALSQYIEEAIASKRGHTLSIEGRYIDRGEWEAHIKVHILEHNYTAADKMIELLREFRRLSWMARLSLDEIVGEVRKFEEQVNAIDIYEVEKEEIGQNQWQNLREAKLL